MSLLMEALRKAEEAKSKAAQEEQGDGSEETREASAEAADLAPENPPPEIPAAEEPVPSEQDQEGPLVIDPEPDEAETLASHSADEEDPLQETHTELSLEPMQEETVTRNIVEEEPDPFEFRPEDFETPKAADPEPPVVNERVDERDEDIVAEIVDEIAEETGTENAGDQDLGLADESDEDDSLSLLESSYFTRTKKPGGLGIGDDLDDFDTIDDDVPAAEQSEAQDSAEAAFTEPEETQEADTEAQDSSEHADAGDSRTEEQEKRSSAGSLFLAKQQSQRKRLRKIISIAAVLLIVPMAGVLYWFYTSYSSAPGMQFNVPPNGGLANQGFLGGDTQANDAQLGNQQLGNQQLGNQQTGDQLAINGQLNQDQVSTTTDGQLGNAGQVAGTDTPDTNTNPATGGDPAGQLAANAGNTAIAASQQNTAANTTAPTGTPTQQQNPVATAGPAPQTQATAATNVAPVNNTSSQAAGQLPGLSFVRREVVNVVNPDLSAAYDSYQQGDMADASRLYQQVLGSDPNNRDAMLGLASVYLKQNNIPMSQNLYARLLELNPRDPIARAGLLDTSMRDDPVRQEAELKALISAYPGVAPLSFALGNLYAIQSRWNEAQSAYFSALLAAKSANAGQVSPDYAYNLAVSLEQLNQPGSALDYYREAAEFARSATPGFDINQLNLRMNYLEQQLP